MLPRVLIIEDEARFAENTKDYLEEHGFEVRIGESGAQGLHEFEHFRPDVVLLDYRLPDLDGLEVLSRLRQLDERVKVIMITGAGGVDVAVSAMKAGAFDYLSKPVPLRELRLLLEKTVRRERLEDALGYYQEREAEQGGIDKLLGESQPMRTLKKRIRQLVEAECEMREGVVAPVLLTGETGVGKERVARALHFEGPRREHDFITADCATIPDRRLDAELFGYEAGAFSSARGRKRGLVEAADGGTLFLDEIGELDVSTHNELLRLLRYGAIRRLGGWHDRKVDVRIVSSTSRPLEEVTRGGGLGPDLFFRLGVVHLGLPPLRVRSNDILLLAQHYLSIYCRRYRKQGLSFRAGAMKALLVYQWPGNVRELRNVIEETVLLAAGSVIEADDLALNHRLAQPESGTASSAASLCVILPDAGVELESLERDLVNQALAKCNGNVAKAARLLGLSRDTLRYRINKYGIERPG